MRAQLARSREKYSHSGGKGANAESVFRHFVAEYLPRRMVLGHGEVVDTHGHRSRETDVVVVNEEHPPLFSPELHGLFYVEGVSAAAEVKSVLDSKGLTDALEKGKVFKQLQDACTEWCPYSILILQTKSAFTDARLSFYLHSNHI